MRDDQEHSPTAAQGDAAAAAAAASPRRGWGARLPVAVNVALPLGLWTLLLLWMVFPLPRFQELFDDFGVRLPVVSELVLRAAEVVREQPLATVGALALLVVVDAWLDRSLAAAAQYSWRQWLLGVRLAIPLGLLLLAVWGVLAPWFQWRGVLH